MSNLLFNKDQIISDCTTIFFRLFLYIIKDHIFQNIFASINAHMQVFYCKDAYKLYFYYSNFLTIRGHNLIFLIQSLCILSCIFKNMNFHINDHSLVFFDIFICIRFTQFLTNNHYIQCVHKSIFFTLIPCIWNHHIFHNISSSINVYKTIF